MNIKNLINNETSQEEYLNYNNATVVFKRLPHEIGGLITRKNDINIIIINDNLDDTNKKRALLHELCHLELNHTYKYKIVDNNYYIYENEVDNYIKNLNFD